MEQKSTRDGFSKAIYELGKRNKSIYALSADLRESVGLKEFAEDLPNQFIECGIAEQNMVSIAAGLTHAGITPFATSMASFQPIRNLDQIRISVCLDKAPVNLVSSHAGFSNSKDGANQQCYMDIAVLRSLPNIKVIIPADFNQAFKATVAMAKDKNPCYLRLSKEKTPVITDKQDAFEIGKAQILKKGKDLTVISAGPILWQVIQAIENLNLNVELINVHTIDPIDSKTIIESAKKTKNVVTIEDHNIKGGLGSAIAEVLAEENVKVKIIGMEDEFGKTAKIPSDLYKRFSLNKDSLSKKIQQFLK